MPVALLPPTAPLWVKVLLVMVMLPWRLAMPPPKPLPEEPPFPPRA